MSFISTMYKKILHKIGKMSPVLTLSVCPEMELTFSDRIENIEEKGENAGYQHFLLFPHCFQIWHLFKGQLWTVSKGKTRFSLQNGYHKQLS